MNVTQHLDYDALNALKDVMEDDFGFFNSYIPAGF